jgi:diguanylate cyclase (GGDEF)-like protein/PAS domain S-box-containing protein
MMNQPSHALHRLLVIDPLAARRDELRSLLNGLPEPEPPPVAPGRPGAPARPGYEVDAAASGHDAVGLLRAAQAFARSHALAFIELGSADDWAGLAVAREFGRKAPELPVLLYSALPEVPWDDIRAGLPAAQRVLFLRWPFDPLELRQIVALLCERPLPVSVPAPGAGPVAAAAVPSLQRLLEACLSHINDMVVVTEPAADGTGHRIVYVNEAFTRLTGHERADVIGRPTQLVRESHADQAANERIDRAVAQGRAVRTEMRVRARDGRELWVDADIVPVQHAEPGPSHWVGILRDISEHKQARARVEHMAFHDPLTGLPNRRLLLDRLQRELAACARTPSVCGLMFIDLDNFKQVNDRHGHHVGDLLLKEVAHRLSHCLREEDTIARFGGDEFVVLLRNLGDEAVSAAQHAELVSGKINTRLASPYLLADPEPQVSASVGIALFGHLPVTADQLLKQADIAMYQAKVAGKNTCAFYDAGAGMSPEEHDYLVGELRCAVAQGRLELKFHPQFDARCNLIGAEALLRWNCAGRGQVPPAIFVPLAEVTGLILPIGAWVLDAACRELAHWSRLPGLQHLQLSINVSARQLAEPDFIAQVDAALRCHAAPPDRLCIELTEAGIGAHIDEVAARTHALSGLGVGVALDKFGQGDASQAVLERLALRQLKIDRGFVRNVVTDAGDATLARTIVAMGHALGLQVLAEGVETPAQQSLLLEMGCDGFQGYVFSRPLARSEFLAYVHAMRARRPDTVT